MRWLICLLLFVISSAPKANGQNGKVINNPRTPDQPKDVTSWIMATQVAEFGGDEAPTEALFTFPAGLVALPDGRTYILDGQSSRILQFDGKGTFIKSFASAGDGPGELKQAWGMFTDGSKYLFIQNQNMMRIARFSLDGKFVDSHSMTDFGARQLHLEGATSDGTLVVVETLRGRYALKIRLIDTKSDWKSKKEFVYEVLNQDKPAEHLTIPPSIALDNNRILVAHPMEYQYRFYDLDGKQLGEMHRDFKGLVAPFAGFSGEFPVTRYFSNLIEPFRLNDRFWIGRAVWPTNLGDPQEYLNLAAKRQAPTLIDDSSFDVFDNDFNLVLTLNRAEHKALIPGGGIIGSDGRGHIFVASATGSVIKYRLEITK